MTLMNFVIVLLVTLAVGVYRAIRRKDETDKLSFVYDWDEWPFFIVFQVLGFVFIPMMGSMIAGLGAVMMLAWGYLLGIFLGQALDLKVEAHGGWRGLGKIVGPKIATVLMFGLGGVLSIATFVSREDWPQLSGEFLEWCQWISLTVVAWLSIFVAARLVRSEGLISGLVKKMKKSEGAADMFVPELGRQYGIYELLLTDDREKSQTVVEAPAASSVPRRSRLWD